MEEFKVNDVYCYNEISVNACFLSNHNIQEYGLFVVGENFLVVKNKDNNMVCSFMLVQYWNEGYYKCIYNDYGRIS